jgi:4-hydroxybenzoate polyprenyltransferase
MSVREALWFGALLALAAFALVLTTNPATVVWSFAALAVSLIYPYAKRYVSMPQAVLGVAFSFGIPMAFAAINGGPAWQVFSAAAWSHLTWQSWWASVPPLAWVLLLGNLFWVLAYDTEYAMVDRDDDLKIGMKTSAITLGRMDVPVIMLSYAIYLLTWAWMLAGRNLGFVFYAGLLVAAGQAVWHWALIRDRTRDGCFKAFRLNHWVGFAVFVGVAGGYALRGQV